MKDCTMIATSKVRNVGNSMGVFIPKQVRQKLALSLEDQLAFSETASGKIIISRVNVGVHELSQQFIIDFIGWAAFTIKDFTAEYVVDGMVYKVAFETIGFFDNTNYSLEDSATNNRLMAMYRAALSAE